MSILLKQKVVVSKMLLRGEHEGGELWSNEAASDPTPAGIQRFNACFTINGICLSLLNAVDTKQCMLLWYQCSIMSSTIPWPSLSTEKKQPFDTTWKATCPCIDSRPYREAAEQYRQEECFSMDNESIHVSKLNRGACAYAETRSNPPPFVERSTLASPVDPAKRVPFKALRA